MPHYKDGTPAKLGDLVRGQGYNVPGEITGKVIQLTEAEACNLAVAHVGQESPVLFNLDNARLSTVHGHTQMGYGVHVVPSVEYGACKDFVKVACFLLALCLAGTAAAQHSFSDAVSGMSRLDRKVDGSKAYNLGRSAEVPTSEASRPFMTLITSDLWQQNPRERDLVSWFNNDPRLAKLRGTTRFNWYTASNPHYRDQLRLKFGEALPIVCVQTPDGQAVVNVTAISMPRRSGELADMLDDGLNQKYAPPRYSGPGESSPIVEDCPDGQCPPLDSGPPSFDNPNDGAIIQPLPEVIPRKPGSSVLPIVVALATVAALLFVAGVIATFVVNKFSGPASGSPNQLF